MPTLFTDAKAVPILATAERLGLHLYRGNFIHCPDHKNGDGVDEHASCSLNLRTGRFRCWSCDNTGSTIDLVAQVQRCSPADAARWLTGQHDLPAPPFLPGTIPSPTQVQSMLESLLSLCGEPSAAAVQYLKGRGIDPAVVRRCRVTDVSDYPGVERGLWERYERQDLIAAGLFSVRGHLKFYKHPLLFPFLQGGRPTYLTARRLDSDQKPKYLSINGPIPHLYNQEALDEPGPVWIAEGVTDTLTFLTERVAVVGIIGAFTFKPSWAGLFAGREVRLALDPDRAGQSASDELAKLLRGAGATMRVAQLPAGMDVNAYYVHSGLLPHAWQGE